VLFGKLIDGLPDIGVTQQHVRIFAQLGAAGY
jgi:hypothetical protein